MDGSVCCFVCQWVNDGVKYFCLGNWATGLRPMLFFDNQVLWRNTSDGSARCRFDTLSVCKTHQALAFASYQIKLTVSYAHQIAFYLLLNWNLMVAISSSHMQTLTIRNSKKKDFRCCTNFRLKNWKRIYSSYRLYVRTVLTIFGNIMDRVLMLIFKPKHE